MAGRHVATPGTGRGTTVSDTSGAVIPPAGPGEPLLPGAQAAGTTAGNDGDVDDGVILGADRSEALEDRP